KILTGAGFPAGASDRHARYRESLKPIIDEFLACEGDTRALVKKWGNEFLRYTLYVTCEVSIVMLLTAKFGYYSANPQLDPAGANSRRAKDDVVRFFREEYLPIYELPHSLMGATGHTELLDEIERLYKPALMAELLSIH
ncbi:MAG: hypothetical protein HY541_02150, partial [Deltaproteobacteria bacterium]|nr:hypothetical protein [Deltaproteobacteria bacterium]